MTNQQERHLDKHGFAENWVPPFSNDSDLLRARIDFFQNTNKKSISYITTEYSEFIERFEKSLLEHKYINVTGLELFGQKDVITGCQHFLDQMILTHGLDNLQVFKGGYPYYNKLKPNLEHVELENLVAGKPLILEFPFSRTGDKHPQYDEIIKKANELGIDVYLDCAWLPVGWDLDLDLSEKCIKGVAMSLSKSFGLHWSRIGVRWLKHSTNDTIAIENKYRMVSYPNVMIGKYYLDRFEMDHLITKYKESYLELCRNHDLVPGKTIMNAYSKQKGHSVGVANLILNKIYKTNNVSE